MAAIAIAGMSVTSPVDIDLILGVIVNYVALERATRPCSAWA
ncbi:hypothetical protein [Adhaeribacter swui]|nr:hypothetical protein [Adhaeribacter swui]